MDVRKIQSIAGSSYSVSLPKDWVKKRGLKEGKTLAIYENHDGSLTLDSNSEKMNVAEEMTIKVEDFKESLECVLLSVYYLGVERINIISSKEFTREIRAAIRGSLDKMSGTEISYEDEKKVTLSILLDKNKINVHQILYRIILLLDSELSSISNGKVDLKEAEFSEREIDRLYNLLRRIINVSLRESQILQSSQIKKVVNIPAYSLISRKFENIGDILFKMTFQSGKEKVNVNLKNNKGIELILNELERISRAILSGCDEIFSEDRAFSESVKKEVALMKEERMKEFFTQLARYIVDVEQQLGDISFYNMKLK